MAKSGQRAKKRGNAMTKLAFLGLGNMGRPMALNLAKAGFEVLGFDPYEGARQAASQAGLSLAANAMEAAGAASVVITMLPSGKEARSAYLGAEGLLAKSPASLFIDCSTIDVESAKALHAGATAAGRQFLDAPVSGGVAGAAAGSLTFMCGGSPQAFDAARPYLEKMGRNLVLAGGAGAGQAAKLCNNMILGITMIGISEAFALAEKLGLDPARLFEISAKSSGSCWAMLNHNPVPGLVPTAAASNGYKPGFAAQMMLKDLTLAQEAAKSAGQATPLGEKALALYRDFVGKDKQGLDYAAIYQLIKGAQA